MIRLCAFDLDGTLVNTIADIAFAANHALEELGYPPCEEDSYRYKVGNGMRMICKRALPEEVRDDERILAEMIRRYDTYYSAHCCDISRAYPGIPELVRKLRQDGILLAVLSNKPHEQTQIVMRTLFDPADFFYVQGQSERFAKKPDPEVLSDCIRRSGVSGEEAVYVGDSDVDVEFARRAGIPCIGAAWGFRGRGELERAGAACIAETAEEIYAYVR